VVERPAVRRRDGGEREGVGRGDGRVVIPRPVAARHEWRAAAPIEGRMAAGVAIVGCIDREEGYAGGVGIPIKAL
jgi:hypothetical protein